MMMENRGKKHRHEYKQAAVSRPAISNDIAHAYALELDCPAGCLAVAH